MATDPISSLRKSFLAAALCLSLGYARPGTEDLRLEVARQWTEKGEYDKAVQELKLYLNEHPDSPEIYARIGGLRMKQGNFKLAGENYKIALAKNPDLAEARAGLADAYEKSGDKAKAEAEREKLHAPKESAKPGNAKDTHGDGKNREPKAPAQAAVPAKTGPAAKDAAAPEALFSPALDSGSSKGAEGIYAQKDFLDALSFYKENKPEPMAAALRRCLAKSPGHPGAYYLGGVMRYEKGEYGKAMYNFKRATEYPDRGFNAYFYMGRILQRQERYPQAIAAFEKYLALTKSEAGRRQAEAYLAQMQGNVPATEKKPPEGPEAIAAAAKGGDSAKPQSPAAKPPAEAAKPAAVEPKSAAEGPKAAAEGTKSPAEEGKSLVLGRDGSFFYLIPDNASPAGKKLAEAYELCKKEKFEKAVNSLKETVLHYGGSDDAAAANLDLASAYLRLGLWESARDRLADYLGTAPPDSIPYYDAAQYLAALAALGLKDGDKAEKALLKIKPGTGTDGRGQSTGPTQEEIDYRLSQAGGLMQDSKKESAYLERAYGSAKDPGRKAALAQQLGFLHAKYGASDKAMDYFRKSMADCKDTSLAELCAESQLRIADMTFKKRDWKGAMAQYRQFAAKFPEHKESAWVHYQMANIYKLTNNFESALNEYKRVIDNYPDSYWASQAKWKREDTIWQKEYEEVLD